MLIPRLLLPSLTMLASLAAAAGISRNGESAFRAGNRFFDAANFTAAVEMYTRALDQDARYIKVYYNRALANEMVDRNAAIRDWKQFLELVGDNPDWKAAASQVRERLVTLELMPSLPDSLQLSRYLPKAGDYYQEVAEMSQGLQFRHFPVKVFVGSVPQGWQRSTREALGDWSRVVPLQQVASREAADIVLSWRTSPDESGHLAWEKDLIHEEDDGTTRRSSKIAVVTLDASRHLSGAQQRAAILHEIGHALGIRGHSSTSGDVMCGAIDVVVVHQTRIVTGFPAEGGRLPGVTSQSFLPTPPKNLTQRDVNTLIRLYNSPGFLTRLEQ
jgi:tetratricopeptide (TPR) repeat protein